MDRPLRLGYVGCGMMAQRVHLPNFTSIPACEVVALAEVRTELGEKVQRRYGIPRLYPDHRRLLEDAEVDAIAVSAPFALQGEIARDALAAGKHVFMEKPMAISVAQAERILAAGEATGARLMVGYMKRYDAGNELVHDTIAGWRASGEVGRVTYARAHGYGGDWTAGIDLPPMETVAEAPPPAPTEENLPDWLPRQWARSYVSYLQQYTHNFNLLRYFLDAGDRARVKHADLDPDGYSGVVLLDVNGTRATVETGTLRCHKWDEHTQVYYERGWVHTWAPPLLLRNAVAEVEIYRAENTGVKVQNPAGAGTGGAMASSAGNSASGAAPAGSTIQHSLSRPIPEPRWSWAYKREAAHFVECVRDDLPFRSSGADTLTDVRLFEEVYRMWLGV